MDAKLDQDSHEISLCFVKDEPANAKISFYERDEDGTRRKVKLTQEAGSGAPRFEARFSAQHNLTCELQCLNTSAQNIRIECDSDQTSDDPALAANIKPKSTSIIEILNRRQTLLLRASYNDDGRGHNSLHQVYKLSVVFKREPLQIQGNEMTVLVELPKGNVIPIKIGDENMLDDLKLLICDETGFSPENQSLSSNGKSLTNSNTTLGELEISDKSQIKCECSVKGGGLESPFLLDASFEDPEARICIYPH